MFHGVEPVIYVVRVAKVQAVRLIFGLITIVDLLEWHLLGTEKVGQLGQIDAVSQVFLALSSRRQLFSYARFDPSKWENIIKILMKLELIRTRWLKLTFWPPPSGTDTRRRCVVVVSRPSLRPRIESTSSWIDLATTRRSRTNWSSVSTRSYLNWLCYSWMDYLKHPSLFALFLSKCNKKERKK